MPLKNQKIPRHQNKHFAFINHPIIINLNKSNFIRIIKNNSKKLPKLKTPFIVKFKNIQFRSQEVNLKRKISRKIVFLKYGKIGNATNKKRELAANILKFQEKIFEVTPAQLKLELGKSNLIRQHDRNPT